MRNNVALKYGLGACKYNWYTPHFENREFMFNERRFDESPSAKCLREVGVPSKFPSVRVIQFDKEGK